MNDQQDISAPMLKVVSMWALIGITSWADFAAFVGAIYTLLLLGELIWKKIIRPLLVYRGLIAPAKREDTAE